MCLVSEDEHHVTLKVDYFEKEWIDYDLPSCRKANTCDITFKRNEVILCESVKQTCATQRMSYVTGYSKDGGDKHKSVDVDIFAEAGQGIMRFIAGGNTYTYNGWRIRKTGKVKSDTL